MNSRDNNGKFLPGHGLGGRPKKDIKKEFEDIISDNMERVREWIKQIGEKNPAKAIELLIKMNNSIKERNLQFSSLSNLSESELDELLDAIMKRMNEPSNN
ncbi:MAG: hypothetical protein R6U04_02645 [Bacteroidales bacterium]